MQPDELSRLEPALARSAEELVTGRAGEGDSAGGDSAGGGQRLARSGDATRGAARPVGGLR